MDKSKKFVPGSDVDADDIFDFAYLKDQDAIKVIKSHGKMMFIVRGPPGSGKISLKNMIAEEYGGVICTADDYFTKTFESQVRTRESLMKSHEYCQKKAKKACEKNNSPIIVSNTHMKKCEMQPYLNLAMEYGYTVIVASTMDKFKINPEILETSNTKGLPKNYFKKRLRQWENVYPILTAWFIGLDDSHFLLLHLRNALLSLLEDGKFCRVAEVFDEDKMFEQYECNEALFAVAGYSHASHNELQDYFESAEVKETIGKAFKILIEAFLVNKSDCFAVVEVGNALPHLYFEPASIASSIAAKNEEIDDLSLKMNSMSLQTKCSLKTLSLKSDFSQRAKTAVLEDNKLKTFHGKKLTFIHLAKQGRGKLFSAVECMTEFEQSLKSCTNLSKLVFDMQCEGGNQVLRLPDERWIVKPSRSISVSTTFTGLFI